MLTDEDRDWLPAIPEGLEPLSPNPGGFGDPDALVGRELEQTRLAQAVSAGGAHVTGERRMGKSWLVRKLQDDLRDTVTAIYISAETSDLARFEDRFLQELRRNGLIRAKARSWGFDLDATVKLKILGSGVTLSLGARRAGDSGAAEPREVDALDLLASSSGQPIVLIIDEITELCRALGPKEAREFLNGLRARRQAGRLPLVLTGSIGLHHTLDDFSPVNDLWTVNVGPLTREDAVILATRLLLGISVTPSPHLVANIVSGTGGIPYYIQGVVQGFIDHDTLDADAVIAQSLAHNVWDTEHYLTRLPLYYGEKGAKRARAILDFVATAVGPVEADAVLARLGADHADLKVKRDDLLDLLDKLEKDHYLVREDTTERMSSAMLTRIWRYHRRLP